MAISPKLLYVADFPPSNLSGGTILMKRLLEACPTDKLTVICGSYYEHLSPPGSLLGVPHVVLQTTDKTGPCGWGRIKSFVDWIRLIMYLPGVVRRVQDEKFEIIMTVAHGYFMILAWWTAVWSRKPLVLVVHDEFVNGKSILFFPFKFFERLCFSLVVNYSSKVYAISPSMRDQIHQEYGKEVHLQMPAIEITGGGTSNIDCGQPSNKDVFKIIFTGNLTGLCEDGVRLLERVFLDGYLDSLDFPLTVEFHVYAGHPYEVRTKNSRRHYAVYSHPWISQDKIKCILSKADVLFLPHSFSKEAEVLARSSFPTKTADYLASGKPILVLAPSYSALSCYAKDGGFAEVVENPLPEALAQGLARIAGSAEYRSQLYMKSLKVFHANHDLQHQRESFYEQLSSMIMPEVLL